MSAIGIFDERSYVIAGLRHLRKPRVDSNVGLEHLHESNRNSQVADDDYLQARTLFVIDGIDAQGRVCAAAPTLDRTTNSVGDPHCVIG